MLFVQFLGAFTGKLEFFSFFCFQSVRFIVCKVFVACELGLICLFTTIGTSFFDENRPLLDDFIQELF